jgi:glyoxylase-like metal-dependent hydrolase (beta-lactamase superfamily II)
MQIRPGVSTHALDWEYDEPIHLHVVETGTATVLFGTGPSESADAVLALASERDVDVAVAEHGDPDHVGGASRLGADAGIEVAIPAGDADALTAAGVDPDHRLTAGTDYWGVDPVAAPGHTRDNMAFLYDDVLVAGDTVVGRGSQFTADEDWSGPLAITPADFNDDDALARESVAGLLEYDFETVLVSHGDHVVTGGPAAVRTLARDFGV